MEEKFFLMNDQSETLTTFMEGGDEISEARKLVGLELVEDKDLERSLNKAKKYNVIAGIGNYLSEEEFQLVLEERVDKEINK